jgi:hypothetical protein
MTTPKILFVFNFHCIVCQVTVKNGTSMATPKILFIFSFHYVVCLLCFVTQSILVAKYGS